MSEAKPRGTSVAPREQKQISFEDDIRKACPMCIAASSRNKQLFL